MPTIQTLLLSLKLVSDLWLEITEHKGSYFTLFFFKYENKA